MSAVFQRSFDIIGCFDIDFRVIKTNYRAIIIWLFIIPG